MVRAMRSASLSLASLAAVVAVAALGCQKDEGKDKGKTNVDQPGATVGSGAAQGRPKVKQIKPPFDTKTPPKDAVKTASGLVYKKITVVAGDAPSPAKNDTVKVHYTGWKADGETVYSTEGRAQPMPMNLQQIPPGFAEAMLLLKKGEKAMLWLPPDIGYREGARPATPEPMAYQVDLVDIIPSMPVPADVGKPPATAAKTPGGNPKLVIKPGQGDKPRPYDNATFNLTAWDADGNQVESTESGTARPQTSPPFRQPKGLEDMLVSLAPGERARFWVPRDQLKLKVDPKAQGPITVEVELVRVDKQQPPPPVPADVAAPPANAKKTAKGVSYKILKAGKGKQPAPTDTVKVHYTGWTTDGRMFDSSVVRGQPSEFPLNGVIPGWTDGLQVMHVGERARLWIPVELAYNNQPDRPAGMLVFDVELLEIKEAPRPPETPPDVAAPPPDAKKTDKGVSFKVLKKGGGGASPGPTDTVKVHYSGWTTDGKMFDSSVTRGQPAEFPLNGVIPGWTDGLQQMKVGDKFRFWIPVELAYNNKPGRPAGMLVFDVELLEIKK
jgi:FKBP-type peptidyl-prolyl cis-trans isomerase